MVEGKEKYILLVEDIEAHAELLMLTLEQWDRPARVELIKDGKIAREELERIGRGASTRPDVLLLDLSLPIVSGHELLAYIRSEPSLSDLPVVITTSSEDESDITRASDLGVSGYLAKPIHAGQIQSVLAKIFDGK